MSPQERVKMGEGIINNWFKIAEIAPLQVFMQNRTEYFFSLLYQVYST